MPDTIWIHYTRARTSWYTQPEEVRAELLSRWDNIRATSVADGGTPLGSFHIRGQSDYTTAEVWKFPTPEDALTHWVRLTKADYSQWFVSANNVGLQSETTHENTHRSETQ